MADYNIEERVIILEAAVATLQDLCGKPSATETVAEGTIREAMGFRWIYSGGRWLPYTEASGTTGTTVTISLDNPPKVTSFAIYWLAVHDGRWCGVAGDEKRVTALNIVNGEGLWEYFSKMPDDFPEKAKWITNPNRGVNPCGE